MKDLKKGDIVKCKVNIYSMGSFITGNYTDDYKEIKLCEVDYYGVAIDHRTIKLQEGTIFTSWKKSGFGKTHTIHNWCKNQWAIVNNFEIIERA